MSILKPKSKRQSRINSAWWINDWSAKTTSKNVLKNNIPPQDYPSNIIMKSNTESIEMIKTKDFLSESLMPSKGIDGTIIIGSASTTTESQSHELLLNIQPLGWIYIPGGKK